jgi:hypothetical protein
MHQRSFTPTISDFEVAFMACVGAILQDKMLAVVVQQYSVCRERYSVKDLDSLDRYLQ